MTSLAAWAAAGAAPAVTPAPATRRMGVLLHDSEAGWSFFRRELAPELARLGWVEGRTLSSEWRYADGDATRLPVLAAALVQAGVDVLLSRGTPATRALQQVTRTVPIVTGVGDPVGAGFARSLAAPAGNITGLSYALNEQITKQLEFLRALVPMATRLLIVLHANRAAFAEEIVAATEKHAIRLGLRTERVLVARVDELRGALQKARAGQPANVITALVFSLGQEMDPKDVALAALHAGVPSVYDQRAYVDFGGLMSQRFNWPDQTRRTAVQLDKILRGADPAGMPFEFPTHSEFVINAKSAKLLGLKVPPALRARADEVLE